MVAELWCLHKYPEPLGNSVSHSRGAATTGSFFSQKATLETSLRVKVEAVVVIETVTNCLRCHPYRFLMSVRGVLLVSVSHQVTAWQLLTCRLASRALTWAAGRALAAGH